MSVSVLDGVAGALVNAGAAVNTFGGVDNGDVVDGDGTLGADVSAGSTSNTVVGNDLRHLFHLMLEIGNDYLLVVGVSVRLNQFHLNLV